MLRPLFRRRFPKRLELILLGVGICAACNAPIAGGQTGDGSGVIDEPGPAWDTALVKDPCETIAVPVDADSDAALGFSAEDILGFAEGAFEAELGWSEESIEGWSYGPDEGSGLRVNIEPAEGAVSVHTERVADGGAPLGCDPYLSVPATVAIETDGGALAESFRTVLIATTNSFARFSVQLPADELDGELALHGAPPGVELRAVELSGFVSRFGAAGAVRVATNTEEGDIVEELSAPVHLAAQWFGHGCASTLPDADPPGVPLPNGAALDGRDFESMRLALQEQSPIPLVWDDASMSALSLGLESLGAVCAVDDGASRLSLRGGVRVELDAADGTISGALDGVLRGRTSSRPGMDSTELTAQLTAPASDFQRQLALAGALTPEYDTVQFSLGLWLGQGHVTGSMQVVSMPTECDPPGEQNESACTEMSVLGAGLGPNTTPGATFESLPPP